MTQVETLSLILSVTGLIASIIFGTFIFSLHNTLSEVKIKQKEIEDLYNKLIEIAITDCGMIYPMFDNKGRTDFNIDGHKFVNWIKSKYKIFDDYQAVVFIKGSDEQVLIEQYIQEELIKEVK